MSLLQKAHRARKKTDPGKRVYTTIENTSYGVSVIVHAPMPDRIRAAREEAAAFARQKAFSDAVARASKLGMSPSTNLAYTFMVAGVIMALVLPYIISKGVAALSTTKLASYGATVGVTGEGGAVLADELSKGEAVAADAVAVDVAAEEQLIEGGANLINQYNSYQSIINDNTFQQLNQPRNSPALQTFIEGDINSIFNAITRGGTLIKTGNAIKMLDGTIISIYNSSNTGVGTIFINTAQQLYKIRVSPVNP